MVLVSDIFRNFFLVDIELQSSLQGVIWHASCSVGSAPQQMGERHSMTLVLVPSPQDTLHALQSSQSPRLTTQKSKEILLKK